MQSIIDMIKQTLSQFINSVHDFVSDHISKDFAESAMFICIIFLIVIVVLVGGIGLISLPFAFLGWAMITFASIFTTGLTMSYMTCVATGFIMALIMGVFKI